MNTVQITGNLAKDPIIRATKTGKAVASFSVGVSKRITKTNGDILDLTDWVNVTAMVEEKIKRRGEMKHENFGCLLWR